MAIASDVRSQRLGKAVPFLFELDDGQTRLVPKIDVPSARSIAGFAATERDEEVLVEQH